jgi:transposase
LCTPTAGACRAFDGGLRSLDEDVGEQIEFVPATFCTILDVRPKLVCYCCGAEPAD